MDGFSFGVAFGAGVLSVANPCAIAMIPAYLALRAQSYARSALSIALLNDVGGLLFGFLGVFTAVGLLLSAASRALLQSVPFVAGLIGLALLVVGLRTLAGRPLHVTLPVLAIRGGAESFRAQLLFGATYGLASLGCALPVFLAYAAAGFATRDARLVVANVASFGLGAAAMLLGVVVLATLLGGAGQRVPGADAIGRYGGGALIAGAGAYVLYLQLGWIVGYPLGVPSLTLPL